MNGGLGINLPSEDGFCTILQWNAQRFAWRESGTGLMAVLDISTFSRPGAINVRTHRDGPTGLRPADDAVWWPPEATRWLAGIRTPPPRSIEVGDTVRPNTPNPVPLFVGEVLAVTGGYALVATDALGGDVSQGGWVYDGAGRFVALIDAEGLERV